MQGHEASAGVGNKNKNADVQKKKKKFTDAPPELDLITFQHTTSTWRRSGSIWLKHEKKEKKGN